MPGGLLILGAGEISAWENTEVSVLQHDGILAFQRKVNESDISVASSPSINDIQKQRCDA